MKCKHCDGKGRMLEPFGNRTIPAGCPVCGGTGKIKQTEEEWFCQLPTEEKAKWFCDHITCSDGCMFYGKCFGEQMGRELWAKWLKTPHPDGMDV